MSRTSIKERNTAIRKAWEKEQQLVKEGKGTRDWTKEQQQDILDPDKGKAYDDQGRAFEGQHMKSAAEYPKYQGDPDNIQFLTREEHLEAHKGSWQNPTNWYYDPVAREFHEFGDGEMIPCKIIELSDPIVVHRSLGCEDKKSVEGDKPKEKEQSASSTVKYRILDCRKEKDPSASSTVKYRILDCRKEKDPSASSTIKWRVFTCQNIESGIGTEKTTVTSRQSETAEKPKVETGIVKAIKIGKRFVVEHPIESIEIAGMVIDKGIERIAGSRNKKGTASTSGFGGGGTTNVPQTGITAKSADIVEKANRAENVVSGHKQRYYSKDGVIWKDKAPYHRGGKDS